MISKNTGYPKIYVYQRQEELIFFSKRVYLKRMSGRQAFIA
jgi:hypothetical protein